MSVTVDVNGTLNNNGAAQASPPYAGYTQNVTAGATALVLLVKFNGLAAAIGTVTLTWDSGGTNQAMTQLVQKDGTNTGLWIFGLRNPTSGTAKTLSINWSGGGNQHIDICGVSYNGSDTTSDATAFPTGHRTTNAGTSITPSIVVTSPAGNQAIAILTEDGTGLNNNNTPNQTSVFASTQGDPSCGSRTAGAGSTTLSSTLDIIANTFIAAGIDIAVPSGGASTFPQILVLGVGQT